MTIVLSSLCASLFPGALPANLPEDVVSGDNWMTRQGVPSLLTDAQLDADSPRGKCEKKRWFAAAGRSMARTVYPHEAGRRFRRPLGLCQGRTPSLYIIPSSPAQGTWCFFTYTYTLKSSALSPVYLFFGRTGSVLPLMPDFRFSGQPEPANAAALRSSVLSLVFLFASSSFARFSCASALPHISGVFTFLFRLSPQDHA